MNATMNALNDPRDTSRIKEWRSIIVLIVFVLANLIVLFPHRIPVPVPKPLYESFFKVLARLRIIRRRDDHGCKKIFRIVYFPMNMVTGPLLSVLFLLAITAIGREEVKSGTVGADNIDPIDIMAFFFTLAYIAISIDASGLIRWLAFKVLQKGGGRGRRLYFYLYCFFFLLSCCIGNDPVILSGTAFLAYMWRISGNIQNPKAWIHAQFAVANMGSAVLVTSNPTNLVLAGAFRIKFIDYTANMIVPVLVTFIVLFPFLLWAIFSEKEIPPRIHLRDMPEHHRTSNPVNPNIPDARAKKKDFHETEEGKLMLIAEIMNPFLDKKSAAFGALIMATTLITILVENAASNANKEHPVYWVTLPAASIMLVWDLWRGWIKREQTRETARQWRKAAQEHAPNHTPTDEPSVSDLKVDDVEQGSPLEWITSPESISPTEGGSEDEKSAAKAVAVIPSASQRSENPLIKPRQEKTTLESLAVQAFRFSQETFPTSTVVITHLPFALVPFALCMFVLVQALVSKGWVPVFAYGWMHWVKATHTVGAIGGMAFLAVVLCNFAGTNIGTTILLSRVIQDWYCIASPQISERTFWATVLSMALGVNFGAFSTALSASLAGLLWRDILGRKHIPIRSVDFARINLPIIAISMVVGCVVLIGEVYITRSATNPYQGWQTGFCPTR